MYKEDEMTLNVRRGDIFCVGLDTWFAKSIMAVEEFWASDKNAKFGHSGIIVSSQGDTFEALFRTEYSHLSRYKGYPILIARPKCETTISDTVISSLIAKHKGQRYPAWRLLFHMFPPLARRIGRGNYLVCSELTAKYLSRCNIRPGPYLGVNPDTLADEIRHWKEYDIILETDNFQI
jgi:hypothetical protein